MTPWLLTKWRRKVTSQYNTFLNLGAEMQLRSDYVISCCQWLQSRGYREAASLPEVFHDPPLFLKDSM